MKILALGAHPDDIEIFMYGLVCIYKNEGNQVFTMIATDGAKGGSKADNLLIKQRTQSAKKCIDKYGWLSSGALILTPLPVLDMIAAAAVNAQMVIEIAKIHGVKLTNERAKNLNIAYLMGHSESVRKVVRKCWKRIENIRHVNSECPRGAFWKVCGQ